MKRDNTVDFFRGLATVWIVFIHTCFWSGVVYVPIWLQSLSLIIDVPLFIFISGMTFNFSNNFFKSIKGIGKIWYQWLFFLIFYFLIILIFDFKHFGIKEIVEAIFFHFEAGDILQVVQGSIWFIFMFFVVMMIGNVIIHLYNKYNDNLNNFKYILITVFLFYGMQVYNSNFLFVSALILMYLFIYLLGYYLFNFKIKSFKTFLILLITDIILLVLCLAFNKYGFLDMQAAKFSAHINYLLYAFISIIVVAFLKDHIKIKDNNVFCFIGKYALIFYFCQGISSSIIYFIYPFLNDFPGICKLIIMYGANICLDIILSLLVIYAKGKIPSKKIKFNILEKK